MMREEKTINNKNKYIDRIVKVILLIATILSASMIILIIWQIAARGLRPFFHDYGTGVINFFKFITGKTYTQLSYRIGFIIINTIYVVLLAVLIATPISILTALFVVKLAPKALGNIIHTIIEVLASIPSIIYGVFGAGFVVVIVRNVAEFFNVSTMGGLSVLSSVLVLVMMIIPTITTLSITSIKGVGKDIEEGALALGATPTVTMFKITLNAAKPGIFAGVILGVGRALGEATAVSMVSGLSPTGPTFDLFSITRILTSTILMGLKETEGLDYDIRFSIGLILIFVILVINFILNGIRRKMGNHYGSSTHIINQGAVSRLLAKGLSPIKQYIIKPIGYVVKKIGYFLGLFYKYVIAKFFYYLFWPFRKLYAFLSRKQKRIFKDGALKSITYMAAFVSVFILSAIIIFVVSKGTPLLNLKVIFGKYESELQTLKTKDPYIDSLDEPYEVKNPDTQFYSIKYGILFEDIHNLEGKKTVSITYIHPDSPLKTMFDVDDISQTVRVGGAIETYMATQTTEGKTVMTFNSDGAKAFRDALENAVIIKSIPLTYSGGGFFGSMIVTLYLVLLTLIIALPIGIFTALYLHEIAPQNKLINIIRSFIDMLTGVPSIIYGLMGAAFFIPLTQKIFGSQRIDGGSLISGALTLAVIILPVIIKSTEAALDIVPETYKEAALALGATKTQTTFKIMLPNALPGILSGGLLAVGRIIGESAALIYAIGTVIKDNVSVTDKGTPLAVHIWSVMQGETPNLALASTISIIILLIVLLLNMIVKVITHRFMKRYH